jgi:hypothetical protein
MFDPAMSQHPLPDVIKHLVGYAQVALRVVSIETSACCQVEEIGNLFERLGELLAKLGERVLRRFAASNLLFIYAVMRNCSAAFECFNFLTALQESASNKLPCQGIRFFTVSASSN